ncbi:DNA-primase RepB domain-containing protein [Paenibacillus arenilitoris]|uniref:RepB-like DNA primase domain-containing protein n=1 Tax=Paenibacillus arenilitoris TaxID=2772299 RepID=A0A927CNJ6_9BACL|nr:DNA-primase RepB domain-containing protein [Paenibacillus arenilitoris]MBD2870834.1 hypothetical protein [Paenibacillus arenilitoris]
MKPNSPGYSGLLRRSSRQAHRFIRKLGCKENERLHFILVHDAIGASGRSHSASRKPAFALNKELGAIEPQVSQMKLVTGTGQPVHVFSANAKGYAVFMEINRREEKSGEINGIRAQFIDVDLNKIAAEADTMEQAKRIAERLRADRAEKLASVEITRSKRGKYRIVARRTKARVGRLKTAFLNRYRDRFKDAMIVETGNGFHVYWAIEGGSLAKFVPLQQALAARFGGDPLITNLKRVMRIPGFYHMKDPKAPYLVRVVHWGRKKPFTQEELAKRFALNTGR